MRSAAAAVAPLVTPCAAAPAAHSLLHLNSPVIAAETMDPAAFAPTDYQKIEGARELHMEELRLRMVRRGGARGLASWGGAVGRRLD